VAQRRLPGIRCNDNSPGPESSASMAASVFTSSSTTRMFAVGALVILNSSEFLFTKEPDAQERKQLFGIHRFGNVIGSTRFQALFTVTFHRFGCQSKNGEKAMSWIGADAAHGFVAIHFRHHDIH
jgi:hypothetical protein